MDTTTTTTTTQNDASGKGNKDAKRAREDEAAAPPPSNNKSGSGIFVKRARSIQNPQLEMYTQDELTFYKRLPVLQRAKVADLEQQLADANNVTTPLRFKVLLSGVDDKIKAIAIQKLNYLYSLDESSSEYFRTVNWIENVCKIPFGVYKRLPVDHASPRAEVRAFLKGMQASMDQKVYGHRNAKAHIVRLLAQWVANPAAKGLVLGLHGPMGCGKTTLVSQGICESLGLPFAFVPLGGASDGCYLDGHSFTYEGSIWGKVVDTLMKTGCMNPVFFFDELDKVSTTHRGQEVINYLIHLTDASQNTRVTDKYFADFQFDLSRSLIIFSYNDADKINPVLRDRMVCIETAGYNTADKVQIAARHMIPELLSEYGFGGTKRHNSDKDTVVFSSEVIKSVVQAVDDEQGVRNLRRGLQDVISNLNLNRLLIEDSNSSSSNDHTYHVTDKDVQTYVAKRPKAKLPEMMYL